MDILLHLENNIHKIRVLLELTKQHMLRSMSNYSSPKAFRSINSNMVFHLAVNELFICVNVLKVLIVMSSYIYCLKRFMMLRSGLIRKHGLLTYLPRRIRTLMLKRGLVEVLDDIWWKVNIKLVCKAVIEFGLREPTVEIRAKILFWRIHDQKGSLSFMGASPILPKCIKKIITPIRSSTFINTPKNETTKYQRTELPEANEHTVPVIDLHDNDLCNDESFLTKKKDCSDKYSKLRVATIKPDGYIKTKESKKRSFVSVSRYQTPILTRLRHSPIDFNNQKNFNYNNELMTIRELSRTDVKQPRSSSFRNIIKKPEEIDIINLSAIDIVAKLIKMKKKKYIDDISYKKLYLTLLVSATILIIKIVLSQTTRRITKRVLGFVFYSLMTGISVSSLVAILIKTKTYELSDRVHKKKTNAN